MTSPGVAAFQQGRDLLVDWGHEMEDVDPAVKHHCDACGTMRVTGTLFRVFDANSKCWFLVARACFYALKKRPMPPELRQEAYEWEDVSNDTE